jgi:hypothetical protein
MSVDKRTFMASYAQSDPLVSYTNPIILVLRKMNHFPLTAADRAIVGAVGTITLAHDGIA